MKPFVVLLVILGLISPAKAQHPQSALYLSTSLQRFSFDQVNTVLSQSGFAETPLIVSSGSGGFGTIGNLRLGGEGTFLNGSSSQNQRETSISGGLGYFYGAYVFQRKAWHLVPGLGLGFGGVRLKATRSASASSMEELFSGRANNSSTVSLGDGFIHTSLGIERRVADEIFLGIKGAYHHGLSGNKAWTAEGLSNSVKDPFSFLQVSFYVGFVLR